MIRTAILGASGYVGGELLRLISGHPELRAARLFGDSKAGQAVGQVHPHLAAAFPDAAIERFEDRRWTTSTSSSRLCRTAIASDSRARSSTAAFPSSTSAPISGWTMPQPMSAGTGRPTRRRSCSAAFVYGIPELNRAAIRGSKAVAAAGCYATAAILALKPLVEAGLVKPDSIIVDAASGVSGAGRELKESTAFNTADGSFAAYGLLNHRHTAEMEMALGGPVLFTPHLAPMTRGILATCYGEATG